MQYRRSKSLNSTFFFTVVTFNRQNILTDSNNITILKKSIKYTKIKHPFNIDTIVVLPDHLHCIWTLPKNDNDFSTRWMLIKNYFTRHCSVPSPQVPSPSRIKKREQCVWQRRFWEHQIRNEEDLNKHIDYIHYNPVKHGHCLAPKEWAYTSFHNFIKRGFYDNLWGTSREIKDNSDIGHE